LARSRPSDKLLIDTARGDDAGRIAAAVTGNRVGDISSAMQQYAEIRGFGVFRDFSGHGVGHTMHEAPSIPFVGRAGTGLILREGLVITIEPVIAEHSPRYWVDPDGWSIRTEDGGWAAQFEHTVIVTSVGHKSSVRSNEPPMDERALILSALLLPSCRYRLAAATIVASAFSLSCHPPRIREWPFSCL